MLRPWYEAHGTVGNPWPRDRELVIGYRQALEAIENLEQRTDFELQYHLVLEIGLGEAAR